MEITDNKYVVKLAEHGQILVVECSPFILSQDLVLLGFEKMVILGRLKIDENLDFETMFEFPQEARCTALSISPDTSISILPNNLIFAAAGADFNLRYFKSDLKVNHSCHILRGHTNYINDVKFEPDCNFLASASDDKTVKLWEIEELKCIATFHLTSPGIATCWHREDEFRLLVAEKSGLIRFYNAESQCPIISVDYGKGLASADWAPSDSKLFASLQSGDLVIWDMARPCVPTSNGLIFTEAGGHIQFSPCGELIAAVNCFESVVKVFHVQNRQLKLSTSVTLPSKLSWHCRSPILCFGDYTNLIFYKFRSK